jgi:starch synthase
VDPNWSADIVHANDWQSSLVPAYLAWQGIPLPTILTIHNLAYQGLFRKDVLRNIGAPESSFHSEGLEFYDKVSFLKAGLVYADHLTTVSEPTLAKSGPQSSDVGWKEFCGRSPTQNSCPVY